MQRRSSRPLSCGTIAAAAIGSLTAVSGATYGRSMLRDSHATDGPARAHKKTHKLQRVEGPVRVLHRATAEAEGAAPGAMAQAIAA